MRSEIGNSLNEFWKISPLGGLSYLSKPAGSDARLFVDDRRLARENVRVRLRLGKEIGTSWLDGEVAIYFPRIYENRSQGDVLAYFVEPSGETPAIVRNESGVVFNFDPEDTARSLLLTKAFTKRPYYTYMPFHYHRVPSKVRLLLAKLVRLGGKIGEANSPFPAWPIEPSLEAIRWIYLNSLRLLDKEIRPSPFWPKNKRYALVLTHDIDTEQGLQNVPRFVEIEEEFGLHSCWYVVGKHYRLDFSLLDGLLKRGFEIGLHGYNHDNKLPFLAGTEIEAKLKECLPLIRKLDMKGFRSPSLLRTKRLMERVSNLFQYDSSFPDTGLFPTRGNGCCSIFPFLVEKLVVLPVTLPPDGTLLSLGFSPERILDMWLRKLDWIKKVGGMALLLTHPEPQLSGNRAMLEIYRRFLREISRDKGAWLALPWQVASHWRERAKNYAE